MLSLPDFREKQVLFVRAERGTDQNLRFLNDNIVFSRDGKVVNRASCHRVFAVFVVGDLTVTSGLLREAGRHGVSLFFLKQNLETYATVNAGVEGHVVLRSRQYAAAAEQDLADARFLVANKIANQCVLLKERGMAEGLLPEREAVLASVMTAKDAATLRGIEGIASKRFFREYYRSLEWRRRGPRTKEDVPNLLLDVGYSLLFHLTDSLLRLHGFDTYRGFYHTLFFQRQSLSCDLMEPMRCLVDRALLKMHNLKQVREDDFEVVDGHYLLPWKNSARYTEIFLESLMEKKEESYLYLHDYYRHVLSAGDLPMPTFSPFLC